MAAFFDLITGAFRGNCALGSAPPDGQGYTAIAPTPGMDNPWWDGTAWQPGDPVPDAPPPPNYGGAWLALITSPLYARALGLAQGSISISTELGILAAAFQAYNLLPPGTWAAALSASCQRLAGLINATATPLTEAEQQWVDAWNVTHHLGLTIDWETT